MYICPLIKNYLLDICLRLLHELMVVVGKVTGSSMVAPPAPKNFLFFASPVQPYQAFPNIVGGWGGSLPFLPCDFTGVQQLAAQTFSHFSCGREENPQPCVSLKSLFCATNHPSSIQGSYGNAVEFWNSKVVHPTKNDNFIKSFSHGYFAFTTFIIKRKTESRVCFIKQSHKRDRTCCDICRNLNVHMPLHLLHNLAYKTSACHLCRKQNMEMKEWMAALT